MSKSSAERQVKNGATATTDAGYGDKWYVRVTDLKQFEYCPRIVYYQYCMPGVRPLTYKMAAGIEAQDQTEQLEKRRTLREYGIEEGTRHFNINLTSERLGCTGQIDLVIELAGGEQRSVLPVDFKLSRREPGQHFRLQLACYAMMLEECWQATAPEGVIYLIPLREAIRVSLDGKLRRAAERQLRALREMVLKERMPPPVRQRGRCLNCEFRRFCNDVL